MDELIKSVTETTEKEFQKRKDDVKKEMVREIVQKTLERIDELDKEIKELEDSRKILKLDLEDLKNGKLNLIEERQKIDEKARKTSLVIIKEVVKEYVPTPWYQPYYIDWNYPVNDNKFYCSTGIPLSNGDVFTCSFAKDHTAGAYNIHGKIINLR